MSLPPEKIVLGGFSQGGMVTLDMAIRKNLNFSHYLLLSANPIAMGRLGEKASGKKMTGKIFQSHGRNDEVLSFEYAQLLNTKLIEFGFDTYFAPFNGGHEISMDVLEVLNKKVF